MPQPKRLLVLNCVCQRLFQDSNGPLDDWPDFGEPRVPLLAVTAIALEHGATENEAIAALLHDAVEDAGRKGRLADIEIRFGKEVADIVAGCTDADVTPKPPWTQRKLAYVECVRTASESVQLVSAADKLHNARCILADYRLVRDALWSRFKGGKTGMLWYLRAVASALKRPRLKRLRDELNAVVTKLERQVNDGNPVLEAPIVIK